MTATTVRARLQNWYWPADAALRQRRLEQLNLTVGGTRGTLKPAFVNVAGIAALAAQWHSPVLVGVWAAVAIAMILASRLVLRPMAARFARPETYARCNALHLAGSTVFVLAFAAAGPLFWVSGEPLNHVFLLLVLVVSATLGVAQTGPHLPLGMTAYLYLVPAIALCLAEGGLTYYVLALLGASVGHMMFAAMVRAAHATEALLDLRASERKLLATQEELVVQLRAANRAKAEFLAHMSHELRTPLHGLKGLLTLLEKTPLSDQQRSFLILMREDADRLLREINSILDFSQAEAHRLILQERVCHLKRLLASAVNAFQARAEAKRLRLTLTLDPALPNAVRVDDRQLEKILRNLIDNAIKYLDASRSGRIVVSGEEAAGGWIVYRISDNGRGISDRDHERIFELFRRSGKQDRPGEGLGLAFVRNSVRRLGGDITLESELGKGSTFLLKFPTRLILPDAGEYA